MQSNEGKLSVRLEPRVDSEGRKYFIGKIKGPFTIHCKDGVAFLIFTSEEDCEEMQICNMTNPKKDYNETK